MTIVSSSLDHLIAYIHLDPVGARFVHSLEDQAWTRMRAYLSLDAAPAWP